MQYLSFVSVLLSEIASQECRETSNDSVRVSTWIKAVALRGEVDLSGFDKTK